MPEEAMDRLYEGPPEKFVAERNALAKRLRADGDTQAATEVGKLRKPTVAASIVNQLARRRRKQVERLVSAAEELQRAQDQVLRGEGAEGLRDAMRGTREAVDRLIGTARSLAGDPSESTLDRVRATLEAAIEDAGARQAVASGRLERELRPGQVAPPTGEIRPAKKGRSRAQAEIVSAERELAGLRERLEEAEELEEEREEEKERAEKRLGEARSALREARETSRRLQSRVRSAEQRLEGKRRRG